MVACIDWQGPILFDPRGTFGHLRGMVAAGQGVRVGPDGITAIDAGHIECTTSGSSGAPKRIRRSLESWTRSFVRNGAIFGLQDAVIGLPGTMAQSLTLYAALEAAWAGAGLVDLSGLRADRQLGQLVAHGVSHVYATPAQAEMILMGEGNAPSLRQWIIGGGRLSADLRQRLAHRFPQARVAQFYGASETSFITLDPGDAPEGSVGRAYPEVEIRTDGAGELWVRSPYLFEGYGLGGSPETRWSDDGFLSVGEIGQIDADGYVYVQGRKGRVVQVLDHLVSPEPAEAFLSERLGCPVAVVARRDALRGARLWAMVGQGPQGAQVEEALAAFRHRVGPTAAPHGWQRVDPLPLLPSGKPDLQRLEAMI
ncbi:AMP-binding protein (plasmid) [Thioclava sp. 'Guangxiensis']|uniref:AMP-binding protein n=1 Tax=Thioclava sp. 'Guangxiensis' TaxID=3149044 RepID=UPI0032C47237